MKTSKAERCGGYTITELSVVMGIIALVGGAAATDYVKRMPYHRMNKAIDQITSDLRLARMEAISENREVSVLFDSANSAYAVWKDSDEDGRVDKDELETKTFDDGSGIKMITHPDRGVFSPDGMFRTQNAFCYVAIFTDLQSSSLVLSPNGHVAPTRHSAVNKDPVVKPEPEIADPVPDTGIKYLPAN